MICMAQVQKTLEIYVCVLGKYDEDRNFWDTILDQIRIFLK